MNTPSRASMPIQLGVNIDHVASIRQSRGTRYPEPVHAALLCEQSGADSITFHLREDRRHIQERDCWLLKDTVQTKLNLEMAITAEMLDFAEQFKAEDICLVPEKREELTTEGGLNVVAAHESVRAACERLAAVGSRVSLFIDADPQQIDAAAACGAPCIEIHTGHFAEQTDSQHRAELLQNIHACAAQAHALGMQVNAGHGLHYHNVAEIASNPLFVELNIGHSIIAQAIFDGLPEAVRKMKNLMLEARNL